MSLSPKTKVNDPQCFANLRGVRAENNDCAQARDPATKTSRSAIAQRAHCYFCGALDTDFERHHHPVIACSRKTLRA
jgi:hypothetical protein